MRAEYSINLLNADHGIWMFVSKNGKVVSEQAGLKTPEQSLKYALAVILSEETDEAKRKEAEEEASRISRDLDGG
jgi:hypothetical protein